MHRSESVGSITTHTTATATRASGTLSFCGFDERGAELGNVEMGSIVEVCVVCEGGGEGGRLIGVGREGEDEGVGVVGEERRCVVDGIVGALEGSAVRVCVCVCVCV